VYFNVSYFFLFPDIFIVISFFSHSWFYLVFYLADPTDFCKYLQYLQQSTTTTSLWIMVLLSFERSFTFSKPFIVQKLVQPRTICLILILITTFCFATHIDELISVDVKAFRWVNFAYGLCSVDRHSRFSSVRIKIVTHSHSFILPFLLNSILDIYICYKICQRRQRLVIKSTLLPNSFNKKIHRRSKKSLAHEITLTLLCQSMWLLITYFPRHLYYFLIQFNLISDHDRDNSTLSFLMRLNLLVYLAFSPALYVILSPTLRREIRSYICLSYKRHRPTTLSNMSNAQDKFRHFLKQHHQQRNFLQGNLTIVITTSEQIPRKIFSESISLPVKLEYPSKSVPCLLLYNHEDEYDSNQRAGRSNTLHE
jgi:hypothetical protein